MQNQFESVFAAKLGLDQPLGREAISWALGNALADGQDATQLEADDVAQDIASDIALFIRSEGGSLARGRTDAWLRSWEANVRLAFGEAQRLCAGRD